MKNKIVYDSLVKNKDWFLTTGCYTSLYFQYLYIAFKIYKNIYNYKKCILLNEENFAIRVYEI